MPSTFFFSFFPSGLDREEKNVEPVCEKKEVIQNQRKKKEAKKGKDQEYINIKRSKRSKVSKMTVCGLLLQLKQKWGSTSISRHLKLRSLFYIHIYISSFSEFSFKALFASLPEP